MKTTIHVILLFLAMVLVTSCCQKQEKESQGDVLYAQAEEAANEGEVEKACQLLQEAHAVFQRERNEEGMAETWLALAQMKTNDLEFDTALIYVDKALDLQVGDSLHAALLCEKGAVNIIRGDLRQGVHFVRRAMLEYGEAFAGEDKAVGCGNAAIACRRLGMPDSARYFLEEGIKAARQVDDDEDLAFLYNNLTTYFCELKRYDEALEACHKAREAATRAGDECEELSAVVNEGVIINRKGDRQKSIKILEEALPRVNREGYALLHIKTLTYLLQTYKDKKIEDGILLATHKRPISADAIRNLVNDIENEIFKREEKEVPSGVIGEIVMEKLEKLDTVAYVRFASVYREFKDINTFMDELKKVLDRD